jgi:hypothetical protein
MQVLDYLGIYSTPRQWNVNIILYILDGFLSKSPQKKKRDWKNNLTFTLCTYEDFKTIKIAKIYARSASYIDQWDISILRLSKETETNFTRNL